MTNTSLSTKGIVLAGGHGTRLYPNSTAVSKQLFPIFSKPTIFYPISTLLLAGIKEIAIISFPQVLPSYEALFGDGSKFGAQFTYIEQHEANGIAEAFLLAEDFLDGHPSALILGDNLLIGSGLRNILTNALADNVGATIFVGSVSNPQEYGIATLDSDNNVLEIHEKPKKPASNKAVIGLYFYDHQAVEFVKGMRPSSRNELEITDLNNLYLSAKKLKAVKIPRGAAWFDTGSPVSQLEASNYVRSLEMREDMLIYAPEEVAWRQGNISLNQFAKLIDEMPKSYYRDSLEAIVKRHKN